MLKSVFKTTLSILKNIFFITWTTFLIWVLFCSFDIEPPLKNLSVVVGSVKAGDKVQVEMYYVRTRQCGLKRSIDITDISGQNVFSSFLEKVVNGNLGPGHQEYDFPIDPKARPGIANFDMYLEWECPYNIVHQTVKPITLHYNVPFEIKEKQ